MDPDELTVRLVPDHAPVLIHDPLRRVVTVRRRQDDRPARLVRRLLADPLQHVVEGHGERARIGTQLERPGGRRGEDWDAVHAEVDRGRRRHRDVEGPRVRRRLGGEHLEVDVALDPTELAEGRVHVGRFGILHPDRDILVHDDAEEREEDEKGHDRADGRGDGALIRPEIADQDSHVVTCRKSSVCIITSAHPG